MQPATGGVCLRVRIRVAVVVAWTVAVAAALAGCVEVPVSPAPSAEPDLSPLEELASMPEVPADELQALGGEAVAFLTESRNAYCAITTEQGGIINSPVDPRLSGGQRDDTVLEVPAVYCELARYPDPVENSDDCYGTGLGFKGGTVLLTADGASYGGCRVGMTLMESELGPAGIGAEGPLTRLPVLEDGLAVELNGFRCGSGERGIVCVEAGTGAGFVASADAFEMLAADERAER